METIKDIENFCKSAVFYDYTNVGITVELNEVRKSIIDSCYETIPYIRMLVSLSLVYDIILKNS